MRDNFENLIVEKPWGYEYIIYKNKNLCITYLNINRNQSTSLHCHPNKKTGYVLLSGTTEVQLGFYNTETFSAPSKVTIRPGLFHSTKAISDNPAEVLELETPIDKNDIVRFYDKYGRENQNYKANSNIKKLDEKHKIYKDPDFDQPQLYKYKGVEVKLEKNKNLEELCNRSFDTIIAVLEGGVRCPKTKKIVLSPGEVIKTGTIVKLAQMFETDEYIKTLSVRRID